MAKEYQIKKTEFRLPHNLYMQIVYLIRDYDRLRRERENILLSSPKSDGQPRGNSLTNSTADKGIKLAVISGQLDAIDRAVHDTAAYYADKIKRSDRTAFEPVDSFFDYGTFCYILYDPNKRRQPSRRSWNYFKSAFAYQIAVNLKMI